MGKMARPSLAFPILPGRGIGAVAGTAARAITTGRSFRMRTEHSSRLLRIPHWATAVRRPPPMPRKSTRTTCAARRVPPTVRSLPSKASPEHAGPPPRVYAFVDGIPCEFAGSRVASPFRDSRCVFSLSGMLVRAIMRSFAVIASHDEIALNSNKDFSLVEQEIFPDAFSTNAAH